MTESTPTEPAWHRTHDLAVMRQALAKLEDAVDLLASVECAFGDMPPLRGPVYGQALDQTVNAVMAKVTQISDALKVAIDAR